MQANVGNIALKLPGCVMIPEEVKSELMRRGYKITYGSDHFWESCLEIWW